MRRRRLRRKWKIVIASACAALLLHALWKPSEKEIPSSSSSFLHPSVEKKETEKEKEEENDPSTLSDWQKVNPDVRYLLLFEDAESIPVIATADTDRAMRHNVYGAYDSMGSVFTDVESSEPDNLVIYGHSSRTKNRAFTFLKQYADSNYYKSHPFFSIQSKRGTKQCRIVSFARYDLNQEDLYDGWALDWFDDADAAEQMFHNTIPYLLHHTDGIVYSGQQIVTLVTCDMSADNTRYVLQALCK